MSSVPHSEGLADGVAAGEKSLESLSHRAPLTIFGDWLNDAMAAEKINPNAMTLATVGDDGMPQARSVLLKSFDENGFVFYTNRKSRKGQALLSRPLAALLFYWRPLARQVLVEGRTHELPRAEVECYFNTRPRDSRIGAWASEQSRPIKNSAALQSAFDARKEEFSGRKPPLPPEWSGFCLSPLRMEFWRERKNRLHQRLVFSRAGADDAWQAAFLQP